MKVAICIGHDSKSKGAFSKFLNQTEFDYNTRVANLVKEQLKDRVDVYNRHAAIGYNKEIADLASRVNAQDYKLVIELHFNSYSNGIANGCEALYYKNSVLGIKHAESFCKSIEMEYSIFNRGAKSLTQSAQNGFGFLEKMKAPAIILEPFFGSNEESQKFINVQRYANTLVKWIECEILT